MTAPRSGQSRLRLRVPKSIESVLRSGHPWVYRDKITEQNRPGESGELAVIYHEKDRLLSIGLYDASSPIAFRSLHTGKPVTIDDAWWKNHLEQALTRRAGLFDASTNGYRLINGESDGWPGLVLDRYDATLVLKIYSEAWFPWLPTITALLTQMFPEATVVLRLSRNIQATASAKSLSDGSVLVGTLAENPVWFRESGLWFEADVLKGQKTGFFLDQRENRRAVEKLSKGRAVLNTFSFSGGFSLYAARGGAQSVTSVDISTHALAGAQRNFERNRDDAAVAECKHEMVKADVFEWLEEEKRTFDLVILDPPSLAQRAGDRTEALRGYTRLVRSGVARVAAKGVLVAASCSAHIPAEEFFALVLKTVAQSGRKFRELKRALHPPDHPATIKEAEYLKCLYVSLDL